MSLIYDALAEGAVQPQPELGGHHRAPLLRGVEYHGGYCGARGINPWAVAIPQQAGITAWLLEVVGNQYVVTTWGLEGQGVSSLNRAGDIDIAGLLQSPSEI